MLTDEQCDEFRRTPGTFNDMVRAIYDAGYLRHKQDFKVAGRKPILWRIELPEELNTMVDDFGVTSKDMQALLKCSRDTLYTLIAKRGIPSPDGRLPCGSKGGGRKVYWTLGTIRKWVAEHGGSGC